ncbi:MAG: 30S ribosomal protein S20 [Verrucomicrobiales bacterium]|jgi:small subunit ribosomal protein S20|nr:30S ribosomal protein S20 [Verrucomicrobiales bacterium]
MANTKSAAKSARSSQRRRTVNKNSSATYKQAEKQLRALVAGGKKDEAVKLLPKVYATLDKAAKKKTVHKNKANRSKSRLAKLVK